MSESVQLVWQGNNSSFEGSQQNVLRQCVGDSSRRDGIHDTVEAGRLCRFSWSQRLSPNSFNLRQARNPDFIDSVIPDRLHVENAHRLSVGCTEHPNSDSKIVGIFAHCSYSPARIKALS